MRPSIACLHVRIDLRIGREVDGLLIGGPAPVRAVSIDGQPPRHADQPGTEPLAIAQRLEGPVSSRERLLRDVFRVFALADDAIRNAEGQRRRLLQPRLEFLVEVLSRRHDQQRLSPLTHVHRARRREGAGGWKEACSNPSSLIPHPESRIPNPYPLSRIANRIPYPESRP